MKAQQNWVYIIFSKDVKDFSRAEEELFNQYGLSRDSNPKLRVHADDKMHLAALKKKMNETLRNERKYKNKAVFVYTPEMVKLNLQATEEHKELLDLHEKHFTRGEDYDIILINEYVKTQEEILEEDRKKNKDMEDWFVSRMRTIADV